MAKPGKQETSLSQIIENAKHELERMIDLHPQGMYLASPDGSIQRANLRLLQILNLQSFTNVIGRKFVELLPEENPPEIRRLLGDLLSVKRNKRERNYSQRISLLIPGSLRRDLDFTVVSPGAESEFFIVVVEDVTHQKEEDDKREKRWKMEAAEAVVGALMHTINQPLTVIMIRAQLLLMSLNKEKQNTEELQQGLEDIVNLTMKVADTLRQARTFNDFVTVQYTGNSQIVDLERSTSDGL
jgi:nitrogen-specific signal transduction histidine kinase